MMTNSSFRSLKVLEERRLWKRQEVNTIWVQHAEGQEEGKQGPWREWPELPYSVVGHKHSKRRWNDSHDTMLMWLLLILYDLEILWGRGEKESSSIPALMAEVWNNFSEGDAWQAWVKTTLKTKCEVLVLKCERKCRAHCPGTIWDFLKHSRIHLFDPLKLSPFVSCTKCYRLQSPLKVNSFLFPSESGNSGLSFMLSPSLLPDRVPKKLICWMIKPCLLLVMTLGMTETWMISFIPLFIHAFTCSLLRANQDCVNAEWKLSWFET